MGKLILVTGGARSGKSLFAEEKVKTFGNHVLYIATAIPFDEEMKQRVIKHREQRPSHWETLEAYKDMDICLKDRIKGKSAAMLDCITIMVTNIMFEQPVNWDDFKAGDLPVIEAAVQSEVEKLLTVVKRAPIPFVMVTNEIGMGIVPDNPLSRAFRDVAGRVNQVIAKAADEVHLCVSGIPIKIKGGSNENT